ncbi:MAG: hydrogenase formation protein HypD [Firmicutes bacterium]|nr:hydrogenase formation protein HypD [Bacillota bacterium]
MTVQPDNTVAAVEQAARVIQILGRELAAAWPGRIFTLMEVCGTHTVSVYRYGLRRFLPENIRLLSGPGCPVCVSPEATIGQALALADDPDCLLMTFGDMLRVPCGADSLLRRKEQGQDVRLVLSPLDAVELAAAQPRKLAVFFAVGFETTAPLTAAALAMARERGLKNFSVLSAHKTMPAALRSLFTRQRQVDGLLCPGHVAAITGAAYFRFVPRELGLAAAVAGFSPGEILMAVAALLRQLLEEKPALVNCYPRAVTEAGNFWAQSAMENTFVPTDSQWRGLGGIAQSGLALSPEWEDFDAGRRFPAVSARPAAEETDCRCGLILQGLARPQDCPLFAGACTPESPKGA